MEASNIGTLPRLIRRKPIRKYSLAEYLQKEAQSTHKHEFINGEIIKMPYAKSNHNLVSMNIAVDISNKTEQLATNYLVYGPDQKIDRKSVV